MQMAQIHTARRKAEAAPRTEGRPGVPAGPSLDQLRGGAVPTSEQMGHRVDLPDAIRAKMEASFGVELSGVELYESQTVADVGARAMALGNKIGFAPGELDFASSGGQALLGHELSHVVSRARGEVAGSGFLNDYSLEARADREGAMAAAGESVYSGTVTPLSTSSVTASVGPMQAKKDKEKKDLEISEPELISHTSFGQAPVSQEGMEGLNAHYGSITPERTPSALDLDTQETGMEISEPELISHTALGITHQEGTFEKEKEKPGLGARIWGGIQRGAAFVGDAVSGKLNSLKRQHQRAVDDLNHHRADYEAMSWKERALWTLKNPLARIMASGSMEDTKARDARAKKMEKKASRLAAKTQEDGGYDLGDAAFDPLELIEGPGIYNSEERARRRQEERSAQSDEEASFGQYMRELFADPEEQAARQAGQEGTHGSGASIQNDVLLGTPKTLASVGGLGIGLGGPNLANVARGTDTLSAGARAAGSIGGIISAGASGMEAAGNIMAARSQQQKGDGAGLFTHSMLAGAGIADTAANISKAVGYMGGVPLAETVGEGLVPGLGIVSGASKFIAGMAMLDNGYAIKDKMQKRMDAMDSNPEARSRDQERMYRTFKQAKAMADANKVQGGMKMAGGALGVTGNAMTLGGVTALAGTVVSGIGTGVDLAGGMIADKMKKGARTDTVNEEIHLDERIKALMAEDDSITEKEAKHIVLKSMGFASGKRREAFQHITMRRAAELYQKANSGDEEAIGILQDLGLQTAGCGYHMDGVKEEYSLQGIAEKLGMDSGTSWQEQMQATKESRGHNPFKKKKDGVA